MPDPVTPPTPQPPDPDARLLAYASGSFPPGAGAPTEAYRQDLALIARNATTLPPSCVLCGKPGHEGPIRLTFTWDASFRRSYVSTLELRKQANVFGFLCALHRRRWRRARLLGGIGTVLGGTLMLAGIILGIWSESSDVPTRTPLGIGLTIAGFAIVIAAMFYFTLRSRTLSCSRIQEDYLYLHGAAESLLDSLPPLPQDHPGA